MKKINPLKINRTFIINIKNKKNQQDNSKIKIKDLINLTRKCNKLYY